MRKLQKDKINLNDRISIIRELIINKKITTIYELAKLTSSSVSFISRLLRYHIEGIKKIRISGHRKIYFFYFGELTDNKLERIEELKKLPH